jgi:hypothetical protein
MANSESKWELFHVRYLMPVFGSEGKEFNPHVHEFMVSTQGGKADAKAACMKYHAGCKIINICNHLEELAGVGKTEMYKFLDKMKK